MSAEHYLSHVVLRRMEAAGKELSLTKFKWIPEGEARTVSPANLKAHVLCKNHNEALTDYDSLAGRFCAVLMKTAERGGEDCRVVALFNGEDLERWMLKMLCGVAAMEASVGGGGRQWKAPLPWLKLLFKAEGAPLGGFGLWVILGQVALSADSHLSMSATPIDDPAGGVPLGLRLHFLGIEFVLMTGFKGSSRVIDRGRFRPGLLSVDTEGYCSAQIGIAYEFSASGVQVDIRGFSPPLNPSESAPSA